MNSLIFFSLFFSPSLLKHFNYLKANEKYPPTKINDFPLSLSFPKFFQISHYVNMPAKTFSVRFELF